MVAAVIPVHHSDPRNPTRQPRESDEDFARRKKVAENQFLKDARDRFDRMESGFLKYLGRRTEPSLFSNDFRKIQQYSASDIAHIRMLDSLGQSYYFDNGPSTRAYQVNRNRDGIKNPVDLAASIRFDLKPCIFAHAFTPSWHVKQQKQIWFLDKKRALAMPLGRERSERLDYLENNRPSGCFTKAQFLHYNCWYFDLDYKQPVSRRKILDHLKQVGLHHFLAAMVETSPHRYHLWFKSEMIASTKQVARWPTIDRRYTDLIYDEKFHADLVDKRVNSFDARWRAIANRGMLDRSNIRSGSTPLIKTPERWYNGDDELYEQYLSRWAVINAFLGGDPVVCDETRVAQLPCYPNPKNGHEARVVHAKDNAEHMLVSHTTDILHKIKIWQEKNGRECIPVLPVEKPTAPVDIKSTAPVEKPTTPLEEKPAFDPMAGLKESDSYCYDEYLPLPETTEDYIRENNLHNEIIWDKDISGKSNEMLLLLVKFIWRYVNPGNKEEAGKFYRAVVEPYFKERNFRERTARLEVRFRCLCGSQAREGIKSNPDKIRKIRDLLRLKLEATMPDERERAKYDKIIQMMAVTLAWNVPVRQEDGTLVYNFHFSGKDRRNKIYQFYLKVLHLRSIGFIDFIAGSYKRFGPYPKARNMRITLPGKLVEKTGYTGRISDAVKKDLWPPVLRLEPVKEPEPPVTKVAKEVPAAKPGQSPQEPSPVTPQVRKEWIPLRDAPAKPNGPPG